MKNNLLTLRETANLLSISVSTVRRHIRNLGLPCSKPKKDYRFDRTEVLDWLKNYKIQNQIEKRNRKKDLTMRPLTSIIDLEVEKAEMANTSNKKHRFNFPYGSIYQRKPGGRWTINFRKNGKRYQEVAKDATSLEEAHEVLVRKKLGKIVEKEKEPITFEDFADTFLNDYSKSNKKSWQCDRYALNAHLIPFFGDFELNDINPLDIEKFRTEKLKDGLKPSSTNRLLALLKVIYSKANEWNYAEINPVKAVKFFSERDNKKERILSSKEETKLQEQSADHLEPIIVTALNTGMRKQEILDLTWDNVDLKKRNIKVTKTKAGKDRQIPINDDLLEVLKGQKNGSGYVFPNPETGKPFRTVRHSFENACRRANIKEMRFHDLRHCFATRLIQKGCDIETLRVLLGHHSITVTERYLHSGETEKRNAVDLLSTVADGDKMVTKIGDDLVSTSVN